jgi:hypothetical protein
VCQYSTFTGCLIPRNHCAGLMPKFSTAAFRADSGVEGPAAEIGYRKDLVLGACLFVLLAYCTATIFVKAAWALQSFQIGIFALLAARLLTGIRQGKEHVAKGLAPLLVYFIPVWGLIQIIAHKTVSTFETREAVLRWGALAAVFFLVQVVTRTPRVHKIALHCYLVTEKGIDPSRISAATSASEGQTVQNYLLPNGADFNTDVPGTTPVDESQIKPQKRVPLPQRHHRRAPGAAPATQ